MDNSQIMNILLIIFKIYTFIWPIFTWGFIIYILSSWVPGLRDSAFGEFLSKIYEPLLEPFRNIIPPIGGMLDLSPIFLIIVFQLFDLGIRKIFEAIMNMLI